MADKFDPYHKWLGIPPRDQPPHHYRLLSIDLFESDPEVIDAAARRLAVYVKSCAAGPHQAEAKKLLSEIVQARSCLMDSQLRAVYDQRLTAPPPGAPPVEPAPAKPDSGPTRRAKRGPNSATLAKARPLGDTPPPEPPAPPAQDAGRGQAPPLSDEPLMEPPALLADTPTDPFDTLAEMPAGITTLPDLTPIGKSHKSGAHKSSVHKSGAHKSVVHNSAGLTDLPLPGVKAKRRKRNQASPRVVLLGLVGVVVALGIVAAVFMKHPSDAEPVKDAQKIAEQPAPEEKPDGLVAAKGSEPPGKAADAQSASDELFEDDDQPAAAVGPDAPVSTKRPAGARGRSNAASLFEAIDQDATAAAVQKLIAAGADVAAKNKDGRTALRIAVIKGRVDLVKALLTAKANPNAADALGETPLMSAAKAGNAPIVKLLLDAGANPNVQTTVPLAPLKSAEAAR